MFLSLRKSFFILITLVVTLMFTLGCSCSTDNNRPVPTNPMPEEPATPSDPPPSEDKSESINTSNENDPIQFEDPVFFELMKKELQKDEITPKDLENYTGFSIAADEFIFLSSKEVPVKSIVHFYDNAFEYEDVRYEGFGTLKSLADLKYFKNLERLSITLQPEIDYSTLPTDIIKDVSQLFIYQSKLQDITFLDAAEKLWIVSLSTNNITSLSPITGKESITLLSIDYNDVEDLTPLTTLINLKSFSAYDNKIVDLSPLRNLKYLDTLKLYQNLIKDISPLKDISTLKNLEMINNQIEDVSPLKDFESFDELRLSGNPITNLDQLSHIENLEYEPVY